MRYAEVQASARRLYLNLIVWRKRNKLLFMWMAIFSIMYGQKIHIVPVCNEELKTVPKIREKIFWGAEFHALDSGENFLRSECLAPNPRHDFPRAGFLHPNLGCISPGSEYLALDPGIIFRGRNYLPWIWGMFLRGRNFFT